MWKGGGEVIGHYVASMNLAKTLTVIPAIQAGVLFASVAWSVASRDGARAQRHIQEATRFALIIAAAAVVILGLDASEVLTVLFSDAYAEGHRFLPLQLAGLALFALTDVFSHSLMAAGRPCYAAGALVVMVPLVSLSNYLFIPRFGPMGAAWSMLAGMAIATVLTGVTAYRRFGSLVRSQTLVRVVGAAVVVGLLSALFQVRGPLVMLKLPLLGGLYLLVLYISGEITGQDFGRRVKSAADRCA
jgi:O-antigen/teichoic acid export membrane protein